MNVSATPFEMWPDCEVPESTTLLGGALGETPLASVARKKFFANEKNLAAYSFDSEKFYTFDFYNVCLHLSCCLLSVCLFVSLFVCVYMCVCGVCVHMYTDLCTH